MLHKITLVGGYQVFKWGESRVIRGRQLATTDLNSCDLSMLKKDMFVTSEDLIEVHLRQQN